MTALLVIDIEMIHQQNLTRIVVAARVSGHGGYCINSPAPIFCVMAAVENSRGTKCLRVYAEQHRYCCGEEIHGRGAAEEIRCTFIRWILSKFKLWEYCAWSHHIRSAACYIMVCAVR